MNHWERRDHLCVAIRVGALLVGLGYVFLSPHPTGRAPVVLQAFLVFAAYSVILYLAFLAVFSNLRPSRLYALLGGLDFVFILVLMHLTGGGSSSLYRAMYLWVAVMAFCFGLKGGNTSSAAALIAFLFFFLRDDTLWNWVLKVGGLMLHGPLIGWWVDHERDQVEELAHLRRRIDALEKDAGR